MEKKKEIKRGRKRDNERGRNQKRWWGNEGEIVREIAEGNEREGEKENDGQRGKTGER